MMAMAAVLTTLAGMLREMGTGTAIIQRSELEDATVSGIFWLNVALGVSAAVALLVLAPVLASAFRAPGLRDVLRALAPIFPISALTTVHQAMLERSSDFKVIARIEVVSSVSSTTAAIIAAVLGAGVYSLVLQAVVAAVLSSVQLWVRSDWRPQTRFRLQGLGGVLRFSGHVASLNLLSYFSRNSDNFLIGRYLGAAPLGAYSIAYRVMVMPLQNLTYVATRSLLPVMSRQSANEEVARLYARTIRLIATMTAPMMLGIVVVREPFVRLLFGKQWMAAADVLAWLAPTGLLQSIMSTIGTVFIARGRTVTVLALGLASAISQLIAFIAGIQYGVVTLSAFYFFANLAGAVPWLLLLGRLLDIRMTSLLRAVAAPIASAGLMAMVVSLFMHVIPQSEGLWRLQLAASILLGAAVYACLLILVFRQDFGDLALLIRGKSKAT
jgi:PST family polysaccharide transporter